MLDFAYRTEISVNASPQAIFDIVSNPARHVELAGSREPKKISHQPPGPVGTGTHILAEETVRMADGSTMDLTADSVVVTYDRPKSFSWIVNPALPEQVRRMQWWFRLFPDGNGTKVVHEVEVDFGDLQNEMLKGLKDNYEQVRAGVVRAGMAKTMENLKRMVEK
ncbi:MAG: SRPBCC family protein [Chloroflexi bacterium]|nr:SRPBCC family protein [Chloroflexota bacterium]